MLYTFNHYYLTTHIARKSSRDIYLSYSVHEPEHIVLLKVFDARCLNPTADLEDFWLLGKRLLQLTHLAVVPVLDLGIEQGQPYAVSEYLPDGTLRHQLDSLSTHHLSLDEALHIVLHIGHVVSSAHTQQVLHLNIKPENIFFNAQGEALLADFSLADLVSETKFIQKLDDRMVSYMAPEQLTSIVSYMVSAQLTGPISNINREQSTDIIGPASDQYALGCLAYELLTGNLPFATKDLPRLWQSSSRVAPAAPSTHLPTLPRAVDAVLLRALSKRPIDRYEDVATFLAELKSAAQPEPPVFPFAYLIPNNQPPAPKLTVTGAQPSFPHLPGLIPSRQHGERLRMDSSMQTPQQQPMSRSRYSLSSQDSATLNITDRQQTKVGDPFLAEDAALRTPFDEPPLADDRVAPLADEHLLDQFLDDQTDEPAQAIKDELVVEEHEQTSWLQYIEVAHTSSETLFPELPEEELPAVAGVEQDLFDQESFSVHDTIYTSSKEELLATHASTHEAGAKEAQPAIPTDNSSQNFFDEEELLAALDTMKVSFAEEIHPVVSAADDPQNFFDEEELLAALDTMKVSFAEEIHPVASAADGSQNFFDEEPFAADPSVQEPPAEELPTVSADNDLQDPATGPLALSLNNVEQDIANLSDTPLQAIDFPTPPGSFLLMKKLAQSQNGDLVSSLEPARSLLSQLAYPDMFLDSQDDSIKPAENIVQRKPPLRLAPTSASSQKSPVAPAPSSQKPPVAPASISQKPPVAPASSSQKPPVTPASSSQKPPVVAAPISQKPPVAPAPISQKPPVAPAPISQKPPVTPASISQKPPVAPASISQKPPVAPASISQKPPVAPASISQKPIQVQPGKRPLNLLLLLALMLTVIVTVLSYKLNPAITSMIQHAPVAATTIARVKLTSTPLPTHQPTPTPTPVPEPNLVTNPTFQDLSGWTCTGATVENSTLVVDKHGPGTCSQTLTLQKNKTYYFSVSTSGCYPEAGVAGWVYWYATNNISSYYPLSGTFSTGTTTSWTFTLTIFGTSATGPAYFQDASVILKK